MVLVLYVQPEFSVPSNMTEFFYLFLIKPFHYNDEDYVIQWARSSIRANTLATLHGLGV
jgi:hypothetical protein